MLLELLERGEINEVPIKAEAEVPLALGRTEENLKAAIQGENFEHTKLYPEFAKKAEEEGFSEISKRLMAIAKAEEHHEERFRKLLRELESGSLFKKGERVWWVCRKCGYVYFGEEPPEKCPSCGHSKNYFQRKCEEY